MTSNLVYATGCSLRQPQRHRNKTVNAHVIAAMKLQQNNHDTQEVLWPHIFSSQSRLMNISLADDKVKKWNSQNWMEQRKWEMGVNLSNHQVGHLSTELLEPTAKQQWFYSFIIWLSSNIPFDVQKNNQRMFPVTTVPTCPPLVYL